MTPQKGRLHSSALRSYGRLLRLRNPQVALRGRRDARNLAMLLRWALRIDSNCVDVGAHAGSVLRQCVRLAPEGRHVAFEPLPAMAKTVQAEFPALLAVGYGGLDDRDGGGPCVLSRLIERWDAHDMWNFIAHR